MTTYQTPPPPARDIYQCPLCKTHMRTWCGADYCGLGYDTTREQHNIINSIPNQKGSTHDTHQAPDLFANRTP